MSWTLEGHRARLELSPWQGVLDLRRPFEGLGQWQINRQPAGAQRLLGVDLLANPSSASGEVAVAEATAPEDCYVRAGDLVATYPQTAERPMRVQIYWRVADSAADVAGKRPAAGAVIDVQVSVQTALLDVPTPLCAATRIAAIEVLRYLGPAGGALQSLQLPQGGGMTLEPSQGAGCLLFRPAGVDWSYAEMIHPADFQRDTLSDATPAASSLRPTSPALPADRELMLCHHLFLESLEKGVILRSRLRGVFLPRGDDQFRLADCYAEFLELPPPLTT